MLTSHEPLMGALAARTAPPRLTDSVPNHSKSVDQDLAEVTARHDAIIQERVKHNHDEVEHVRA